MTTTYILESGYSSVHKTTIEEIHELLKSITKEEVKNRCELLNINKVVFDDSHSPIEEYYNEINRYWVHEDYINFQAYGGASHRRVLEFVIKVICMLVIEKGLLMNYNINLRSR